MNRSIYNVFDLFDQVFKGFEVEDFPYPTFPPYDVIIDEETKDITFRFAVAGYDKEEVEIEFENDALKLTLPSVKTEMEGKLKVLHKGIKTSSSVTKYAIPQSKYNVDKASASLSNGILTIFIPAKEDLKPKRLKLT